MRGEDGPMFNEVLNAMGSPPHARGRPLAAAYNLELSRITPACAGKTSCRPAFSPTTGDHPRMRGEDVAIKAGEGIDPGSPPHARGRPQYLSKSAGRLGITPACAGKTDGDREGTRRNGDHPRMRGEDVFR